MKKTLAPALIALTLLPAAAGADIVPQKELAGVSIGASEADVKDALGKSPKVKNDTDDFGKVRTYTYGKTTVNFRMGEDSDYIVFQVSTVSKSEKTSSGIGVGSSENAVKDEVAKVKCETIEGFRSCHVGSFKAGRIVTDFTIEAKKVVRVTLGRVVD